MSKHEIPEEAVVAGAKAMDAYWGGRYAPDEVEELRGEVTAILEAVTPLIAAEAWDEGHAHYGKFFSPNFPEFGANPYRATK